MNDPYFLDSALYKNDLNVSRRDGEEQVRLLILQGSTEEPRKNLHKIPQEVQPLLSTFQYLKASNGQASKKNLYGCSIVLKKKS